MMRFRAIFTRTCYQSSAESASVRRTANASKATTAPQNRDGSPMPCRTSCRPKPKSEPQRLRPKNLKECFQIFRQKNAQSSVYGWGIWRCCACRSSAGMSLLSERWQPNQLRHITITGLTRRNVRVQSLSSSVQKITSIKNA